MNVFQDGSGASDWLLNPTAITRFLMDFGIVRGRKIKMAATGKIRVAF